MCVEVVMFSTEHGGKRTRKKSWVRTVQCSDGWWLVADDKINVCFILDKKVIAGSVRPRPAPAPGTVIVQPRCGGGDTASYLAQAGAELGAE